MKRAKVNQRSRQFPVRQEQQGRKNMFDLSHDVKTTFTMGKLVPFFMKETISGDKWFLRSEIMMRFAPLYLPIMHRVNVEASYYYVSWRILWPNYIYDMSDGGVGWERFLYEPNSGLEHPFINVTPGDWTDDVNELLYYMGFPSNVGSPPPIVVGVDVNAGPAYGYYMIWDQFYRNDQVQNEIWHPLNPGMNDGLQDPTIYDLWSCMRRNWNRDYYTSATPEPQLGSDVLIPLVDSDFLSGGGLSYGGPYGWNYQSNDAPVINQPIGTDGSGDSVNSTAQLIYLDIQETAGTVAQLRYALMLQEYLERANRAGDRYSDRQKAFWDTDPYMGVIQRPQWIGTKFGKVVVSEVLSTTETATLKVGSYAGQALTLESTDIFSYECEEHGFVYGIISVYPDSSYMQGLDKVWTKRLQTDYPWEQFALIGDQEILNKEVNWSIIDTVPQQTYNDEVFGYTTRYAEYMYSNDIYSGLMRTTLISFHLGRLLDEVDPSTTVLDDLFLQCRPDVTRVFQVVEGEDEIYAHIYNDVKVLRRLPKHGIPQV